jgi:hypothetical protein
MSSLSLTAHERRRHEALEALTQGDFARAVSIANILLVLDPGDQTAREVLAEATAELDVLTMQNARTHHSELAGSAQQSKTDAARESYGPVGDWNVDDWDFATSENPLPVPVDATPSMPFVNKSDDAEAHTRATIVGLSDITNLIGPERAYAARIAAQSEPASADTDARSSAPERARETAPGSVGRPTPLAQPVSQRQVGLPSLPAKLPIANGNADATIEVPASDLTHEIYAVVDQLAATQGNPVDGAPATERRPAPSATTAANLILTSVGMSNSAQNARVNAELRAAQAAFAVVRPRVVVHVPRRLVAMPPAGLDAFTEQVFMAVDGKRSMLAIASRVGSSPEEIDQACAALRALEAAGAIELTSR